MFLKHVIIISLVIMGSYGPATAQGEKGAVSSTSDLEEILEGFDDPPTDQNPLPDEMKDVLDGFEDDTVETIEIGEREVGEKQPLAELSGTLSLGTSFAYAHDTPLPGETDYYGITRFRPDLYLELDLNFSNPWRAKIGGRAFYDLAYGLNNRDQFTDETLDEYETEAELWEVYLQGPLFESLDIKLGRQVVVWGKSDNIRVVDILNPLDNREPGLVDIEDLRLPVTMTKVDYYFGSWCLTGIAVHEIRFNKTPVFGSEFFPGVNPLPPEVEPGNSLDNTEFAFALSGIFSGWDVAFYWAHIFDDTPHVEMPALNQFERRHSLITMTGLAAGLALGNWLLKTEAAYFDGLEYFGLPGQKKERFDALLGVEYGGISNTMISLEVANRHIIEFESSLDNPIDDAQENALQTVLRISGDYFHDTVHPLALVSLFDLNGKGGSFERFSIGYDVTDALEVTTGVVLYQSGDRRELQDIGDKDRIFIDFTYHF